MPGGGGSAVLPSLGACITNQFYHTRPEIRKYVLMPGMEFTGDWARDGPAAAQSTCVTILRMSETRRYLPPSNQVGVVAATVLLCFALTHLAGGPGLTMTVQLPGFYFAYSLTLGTAMTMIAAGLTASGMEWLLHGHPALGGRPTLEQWLLPSLTAFIIGVLLGILPRGRVVDRVWRRAPAYCLPCWWPNTLPSIPARRCTRWPRPV